MVKLLNEHVFIKVINLLDMNDDFFESLIVGIKSPLYSL